MIDVEVKATQALGAMKRFALAMADRRTVNRQIAVQFFAFTQKSFATAGANQPGGWRPLAPSTLKARARNKYGSRPLVKTGFMRASFLPFSDNDQAGLGANASYSIFHQEGTERIPRRPMLPPVAVGQKIATDIYGLKLQRDRDKAGL